MTGKVLAGCRVLILEDDYFQADDARLCLAEAGAQIVAVASNTPAVTSFLDGQQIDVALLDINLGNESSFEVARILIGNDVRVLFLTGYERGTLPIDLADTPLLTKPFDNSVLVQSLGELFEGPMV